MSIQRLHVGPRMSEVAIHQGVAYFAGQVAEDPSRDVAGQTPPRATIEAQLAKPDYKVEIKVIATM
jgi:enamine deaminase RidA (YjgF/YER057c/UK114 family)